MTARRLRAWLNPWRKMRKLVRGTMIMPPRLRPLVAMLMAKPRFRINQFVKRVLTGMSAVEQKPRARIRYTAKSWGRLVIRGRAKSPALKRREPKMRNLPGPY